jgi:hypothetical protein
MSKPTTLSEVVRDINLLDDEWTICAKWPWTAESPACVARTAANVRHARARDLEPFIAVKIARAAVDGMDPRTWVNHVIHFAEHDAFPRAA